MTFVEFSGFLDRIESTTLRNQMMEILADLFKKSEAQEIYAVVSLSLGQLRPKFARLEFNLADKMVVRALAQSFNTTVAELTSEYKRVGDLGVVAQAFRQRVADNASHNKEITIVSVYEVLTIIAQDEGQGSQERKIAGLSNLLNKLDPLSARYVVRIVLGKLRLGFSDKTILDALSYMESGSKDGRNKLDWAYQVYPDIAQIAYLVKVHGISRVSQMVHVCYGVPVVPALAQRLKTADEMIHKMGRVILETKYDGTRVQIHFRKNKTTNEVEVRTFTRNLDENGWMFPELKIIDHQIDASEVILDCEAIGYDPSTRALLPFQMTITRKRKHGIEEAQSQVPLKFFVFDILYKDGEILIQKPLSERRAILERTVSSGAVLEIDRYIVTDDPEIVRSFHKDQLAKGYEGAMVKQAEGEYSPGRTGFNWVKFKELESTQGKLSDTIDCVVMGGYYGKGKRTRFGIGAFLVGVLDGNGYILTIAKIGTGLSDEQWREMHGRALAIQTLQQPRDYGEVHKTLRPDFWLLPQVVVEVAADEITKSPTHSAGYALRFPRLVRFRDDKSVSQSTTTAELKHIF